MAPLRAFSADPCRGSWWLWFTASWWRRRAASGPCGQPALWVNVLSLSSSSSTRTPSSCPPTCGPLSEPEAASFSALVRFYHHNIIAGWQNNLWTQTKMYFHLTAMQEEALKLVLLALEDGSALSRKVLVLFVVQRLEPRFPQASKTSIGHVVQLLYRASCFKVLLLFTILMLLIAKKCIMSDIYGCQSITFFKSN